MSILLNILDWLSLFGLVVLVLGAALSIRASGKHGWILMVSGLIFEALLLPPRIILVLCLYHYP